MLNELFEKIEDLKDNNTLSSKELDDKIMAIIIKTGLISNHSEIELIDCFHNYCRAKQIKALYRRNIRFFRSKARKAFKHYVRALKNNPQAIEELDNYYGEYLVTKDCLNFYIVEFLTTRYELAEYRDYILDRLAFTDIFFGYGRSDEIDHTVSKTRLRYKETLRKMIDAFQEKIEDPELQQIEQALDGMFKQVLETPAPAPASAQDQPVTKETPTDERN